MAARRVPRVSCVGIIGSSNRSPAITANRATGVRDRCPVCTAIDISIAKASAKDTIGIVPRVCHNPRMPLRTAVNTAIIAKNHRAGRRPSISSPVSSPPPEASLAAMRCQLPGAQANTRQPIDRAIIVASGGRRSSPPHRAMHHKAPQRGNANPSLDAPTRKAKVHCSHALRCPYIDQSSAKVPSDGHK